MLHFEGDRDFRQAPTDLWTKLSDARFLVQCIPGVETVKRAEPDLAVWTLRPNLGFVRGTLEVTLKVVEAVAEQSMRLLVQSKGIGTTSTVEALFDFAPHDSGTRVHWQADIKQLGGLLKMVPQGLIQASAKQVIDDVWKSVKEKLGE